jgi:chromosomal replication initiator protein
MSSVTASSHWPEILDRIEKKVSGQQFATWFRNLRATLELPARITLRVPNHFFKEWLGQNYLPVIVEAVEAVTGARPAIEFTVDASLKPDAGEAPLFFPSPAASPRSPNLRLNEHYTFETFVVGPSNQLAHAAALAVCESPGKTYNPLFVHGSVGLGKSHLLQAICQASLGFRPNRKLAYLSCETFVNEFISAIQRNDLGPFRARYRQLDFLLIDDIQFLSRAERSQEEFFHTFNDLYNAQRQVVLSSDLPPHEIAGLQERLTSRFKSGLVARVDPPSYEMRIAILNRKAEIRNIVVPTDVIEYIATIITTNIRELDGAITKVTGYASLLGRPISLEVARIALDEPVRPGNSVNIDEIIKVVTTHFNVRLTDLQSRKRTRSIVLPRQICMFLARSLTPLSLEEIGGHFGGRDHTTVLHAEEKIRLGTQHDEGLASTISELLRKMNVTSIGHPSIHGGYPVT